MDSNPLPVGYLEVGFSKGIFNSTFQFLIENFWQKIEIEASLLDNAQNKINLKIFREKSSKSRN